MRSNNENSWGSNILYSTSDVTKQWREQIPASPYNFQRDRQFTDSDANEALLDKIVNTSHELLIAYLNTPELYFEGDNGLVLRSDACDSIPRTTTSNLSNLLAELLA